MLARRPPRRNRKRQTPKRADCVGVLATRPFRTFYCSSPRPRPGSPPSRPSSGRSPGSRRVKSLLPECGDPHGGPQEEFHDREPAAAPSPAHDLYTALDIAAAAATPDWHCRRAAHLPAAQPAAGCSALPGRSSPAAALRCPPPRALQCRADRLPGFSSHEHSTARRVSTSPASGPLGIRS